MSQTKVELGLDVKALSTITTADNTDTLTIESTDADSSGGPVLRMYRNSSSPADNDTTGKINFVARNDNSQDVTLTAIEQNIVDASDGVEDGLLYFRTMKDGTLTDALHISPTELVINDSQVDRDFRIESDSNAILFKVQGVNGNNSAGTVGINSSNSDGNMFEVINPEGGAYAGKLDSSASSGAVYLLSMKFSGQAPDDNSSYIINARDSSTARFRVFADGDVQNHDNSYGAISDERIKSEIVDANSQWDDIKAVRVRKYSLKDRNLDAADSLGVIAQELEASGMNGLVKEVEADTDSEETVKAVKYSILYMKAVKALQEAMARIETLEAKVTALENA